MATLPFQVFRSKTLKSSLISFSVTPHIQSRETQWALLSKYIQNPTSCHHQWFTTIPCLDYFNQIFKSLLPPPESIPSSWSLFSTQQPEKSFKHLSQIMPPAGDLTKIPCLNQSGISLMTTYEPLQDLAPWPLRSLLFSLYYSVIYPQCSQEKLETTIFGHLHYFLCLKSLFSTYRPPPASTPSPLTLLYAFS